VTKKRRRFAEPEKGGVAEWSIASVLKTEVGKLTVGSNPTPSASLALGPARTGSLENTRPKLAFTAEDKERFHENFPNPATRVGGFLNR
jgi:hypothetical protein